MTALSLIATALLTLSADPSNGTASRPAGREPKLIEFGWDEPDTAFMRKHAEQMDKSPFDGCVFHVNYSKPGGGSGSFTWDCWGKKAFTAADLQASLDDLKQAKFKKLRHNFLRFNTTPADIDWFDDFSAVLANAKLAARVAREGGAAGLLFDIEQYNAPLFDYHKQRDAATKSWDQYAAQTRLRGREVMNAFQEGYPDLKVFLTFGYSLPWSETDGGKKPLADGSYGLLAPFLDGLVDAARGKTALIDGCESAYSYREEKKFAKARRTILQELLPLVADRDKYGRHVSVSFGLWMDYDWRKQGWDTADPAKNPQPPEQFGRLVRLALDHADDYVWIYTETPRWWSEEGGPVKLHPAYDAAIRAAKVGTSRPE